MIEFKILTLPEHTHYVNNFTLLEKMVFEELYRYYYDYNLEQAPYDYYSADYVISPTDEENHSEYFALVKPLAIDLYDKWYRKLLPIIKDDVIDIKSLNRIGDNIIYAKDMVDLVWYSQQLLDAAIAYRRIQRKQ